MSDGEVIPLHHEVALWIFFILLGPIHFTGEMIGPAGGTSGKQWLCAVSGSLLWLYVILWVIQHV